MCSLPHPKAYPFCGPNSLFRKASLLKFFYEDPLNHPEISWTGCITEGPYNLAYGYIFQDMSEQVGSMEDSKPPILDQTGWEYGGF